MSETDSSESVFMLQKLGKQEKKYVKEKNVWVYEGIHERTK